MWQHKVYQNKNICVFKIFNYRKCSHKWSLGPHSHLQLMTNTTWFFELHSHAIINITFWSCVI
jgi:hypothetical protein